MGGKWDLIFLGGRGAGGKIKYWSGYSPGQLLHKKTLPFPALPAALLLLCSTGHISCIDQFGGSAPV